jgi:hypothetical protein
VLVLVLPRHVISSRRSNGSQLKPNTDQCVQSVIARNTSSSLTIPFLRVELATTRHALIGSSASLDSVQCCSYVQSDCFTHVLYSRAPHNDVSVNDRPHIRRWSHNFVIIAIVIQLPTVFSTVTCCTGL